MRAVVLAYHDMGVACLDTLLSGGIEVAAVYTHLDDPEEKIWFGSVADRAAERGIPVRTPAAVNDPGVVDEVREMAPDIFFSFHYRRLLGSPLLAIPPRGGVNVHASLLPRYRGRCPVNWVLINGETETGVTLHRMVEAADAGDILAQCRIPIRATDTAESLYRRLVPAAACLLRKMLPRLIQGTVRGLPQHAAAATTFRGRRPADGAVDWSAPARSIVNLVRAVTHPYPGAFTHVDGRRLFIWDAGVVPDETAGSNCVPGRMRMRDGKLLVETGGGALVIRRAQLEGEPEKDGAALASRLSGNPEFDCRAGG